MTGCYRITRSRHSGEGWGGNRRRGTTDGGFQHDRDIANLITSECFGTLSRTAAEHSPRAYACRDYLWTRLETRAWKPFGNDGYPPPPRAIGERLRFVCFRRVPPSVTPPPSSIRPRPSRRGRSHLAAHRSLKAVPFGRRIR